MQDEGRKELTMSIDRSRDQSSIRDGARPKEGELGRVRNERRNEGYFDVSGVRLFKHLEKINYKNHLEIKVSSDR